MIAIIKTNAQQVALAKKLPDKMQSQLFLLFSSSNQPDFIDSATEITMNF